MSAPFSQKRELGQHFLVDQNILGVIGRLAELETRDVVLEVGPGLGVLTVFLAERVARVHAIELDETLGPYLRERLAGRPNVELTFADALTAPLGELDPSATKLVANLPYSIATPLVVESLRRAPDRRPVVRDGPARGRRSPLRLSQDEGVRRRFGSRAARSRAHGVPPGRAHCFRPPPNVDSALVAFRRRPDWAPGPALEEIVHAAFAHRRKTLANSLELSGVVPREEAVAALSELGREPNVRAEALEPGRVVRSPASRSCSTMSQALPAAAKINLALVVGGRRPDGLHEVATVMQRVDICDRVEVERAAATAVEGYREDTIVRAALERLAAETAAEGGWRVRLRKGIPVAAGLGGGSADAAAALVLANAMLAEPLPPDAPRTISPRASAPTCRSSSSPARSSRRAPVSA